jgi:branched-chain amino acid transport system substrate-binding protein
MAQAVEATKSLDQKLIADYMHKTTFDTIAGPMAFDRTGEQPNSRVLLVQYQGIEGNAVDQFKLPGKQVIIFPPELRSGEFRYPFSDIKR